MTNGARECVVFCVDAKKIHFFNAVSLFFSLSWMLIDALFDCEANICRDNKDLCISRLRKRHIAMGTLADIGT